jgi:hypothetical protein
LCPDVANAYNITSIGDGKYYVLSKHVNVSFLPPTLDLIKVGFASENGASFAYQKERSSRAMCKIRNNPFYMRYPVIKEGTARFNAYRLHFYLPYTFTSYDELLEQYKHFYERTYELSLTGKFENFKDIADDSDITKWAKTFTRKASRGVHIKDLSKPYYLGYCSPKKIVKRNPLL